MTAETATANGSHMHNIIPYDYLLVLDLEATCDNNGAVTKETAEIIELSTVFLETTKLENVLQLQTYVRPERTPLTPFCTQLTNITWDKLENAGTLADAVRALDRMIQTEIEAKNKTFCFVTHGSWDLRIQLPREAKDKEIQLPPYLNYPRMFDLKQEYQRWQVHHPEINLRQTSLTEMCEAFQLPNVGPAHSGLNDSLTMVHIIRHFVKFGHSDVFVHPIDTNADLQQFKKEASRVVHLASLPYDVLQQDLEAWFATYNLRPLTMWMIKTSDSRSSGSGFAIFEAHEMAMSALSLNGGTMGDRSIEVSPSSDRVIEAAGQILASFPREHSRTQSNAPILRPGDWQCPNCQFHNFASRRHCLKCNTESPNSTMQPPPNFAHGDWICPNPTCQFHNYASRSQCLRCHSYRPANIPYHPHNSIPFRPGDWICSNPNCGFQNFASRSQCMRCQNPNTQGYGNQGYTIGMDGQTYAAPMPQSMGGSNAPFRPGDWYCPACHSHNFASRIQCLRCGIQKPASIGGGYSAPTTNMKPGDWICSCSYHNFAKRSLCAKCGQLNTNALNQGGYGPDVSGY